MSKAGKVAPAADRATLIPGAPPEVVQSGTGFNCVAVGEIGEQRFRIVLDSGAARNVIRTGFAEQLRASPKTQHATYGPRPMSDVINFVGVIEGMKTSDVTHATQLTMTFTDVESGKKASTELCFGELAEASDATL